MQTQVDSKAHWNSRRHPTAERWIRGNIITLLVLLLRHDVRSDAPSPSTVSYKRFPRRRSDGRPKNYLIPCRPRKSRKFDTLDACENDVSNKSDFRFHFYDHADTLRPGHDYASPLPDEFHVSLHTSRHVPRQRTDKHD